MKDWIKNALTKRISKRTRTIEIPPDPRLLVGTKFAIAITFCLTALEIAHLIILNKWNSEIFAAITGLTGTITGIFLTQKT